MKVLIGTPVHQTKDYAIPRWLKNVSELRYPADLLLVDNSPGTKYQQIVMDYARACDLSPTVKHLEFGVDVSVDARIKASQETIRQFVLDNGYDAWFSLECDQLIPPDTLDKLVSLMKKGKFEAVFHNSWARWDQNITNTNMGVTLLSRRCLKLNWFLPSKEGKISYKQKYIYNVNNPDVYKQRVIKSGGNYAEIYGLVNPVLHLNK